MNELFRTLVRYFSIDRGEGKRPFTTFYSKCFILKMFYLTIQSSNEGETGTYGK